MLHSVPDPRLPLSSATPAVQFTVAAVPAPRAQAAVHPAPLPRRCAQAPWAYPPPKINPEAVSQPRHHATFLKLSSPLWLSLALTSPRVSPPPRDAIPASTSQSAPATSIKRRHLTLPPLPHPPRINALPTAVERDQRLEGGFVLFPERMRGGGGGSGLGFPGGVLVEEEGEEVVSAPERPMRRRRRRWGVEVDDGYSPSSTGGGGSSCCDSFGCDSVGPCSSLLS